MLRFLWEEEEKATTFNLPQEVLLMIFRHLDTAEDLCAVSAVCKVFNVVSADDILWRPLCSPSWKIRRGYHQPPLEKIAHPRFVLHPILFLKKMQNTLHELAAWSDQGLHK